MKPNKLTHNHNLLWESYRIVLPELVEKINNGKEHQNDVPKPILSDDQLEEIQRTVQEAIEFNSTVQIAYYNNRRIHQVTGIITRVLSDKKLEIEVSDGLEFIPTQDIIKVNIV